MELVSAVLVIVLALLHKWLGRPAAALGGEARPGLAPQHDHPRDGDAGVLTAYRYGLPKG